MPRRPKKRSKKAGLPPGSLIHIGEQLSEKTRITVLEYDESHVDEKEVTAGQLVKPPSDRPGVTWIHVDGIHDTLALEKLGRVFGLHPLILEDILNTDQRPKVEDSCDCLFIVLKMFHQENTETADILPEQVSFVLGPNFVISLLEKEGTIFNVLRERIKEGQGRLRKAGADYLSYTLIDNVVDSYFAILENLGEKIETAEENLVTNPGRDTIHVIQHLKREMLFLRKSIWPLREVVNYLQRMESPLLQESTDIYFKDLYDHTVQILDTIETYRDMLSGMLDIYLSSVSNRMNEIMKVLTIIATFFMPMTFLAGVYGMNFKYFPELNWQWGYFLFWVAILIIAVAMMIYFKRKKWL